MVQFAPRPHCVGGLHVFLQSVIQPCMIREIGRPQDERENDVNGLSQAMMLDRKKNRASLRGTFCNWIATARGRTQSIRAKPRLFT